MTTKRKLTAAREAARKALAEASKSRPLAYKHVRYEQKMERMLEGINPDRFEALAAGRLP